MAESTADPQQVLAARQRYAQNRLADLATKLTALPSLHDLQDLCIYATGSFGRLEASEHSDLDLFFIQTADYRDYQDHEKDFRPVFITNDIMRFWKTLCLNYEHRRNRPSEDELTRAKSHVKNLKLKFSRMLTCYSTLAWIARQPTGPGPEELFNMVQLAPLQRLQDVSSFDQTAAGLVRQACREYAWFLETVGRPEQETLDWIRVSDNRDSAFDHARRFGQEIFDLILHLARDKPFLRYMVV